MEDDRKYTIYFEPTTPLDAVEATLVVAVMAVESLLGRPALKLDATYRLDKARRTCVVDASTLAGKRIARVFVGLLAREFGEGAFAVERHARPVCEAGGLPR